MTHVMCNPWKRTFTLVPLAPLTVISPMMNSIQINLHAISFKCFHSKWNLISTLESIHLFH
jgi:hypothetical protein